MANAKKGFDPLSSLFDLPTPQNVAEPLSDPPMPEESLPPVTIEREPERVAPPPPAAAPAPAAPAVDPVALARMLAKAAAAKAGAPQPPAKAAAAAPKAAAPPAPVKPAARAAPKAEPAPSSGLSRAFAAPPPKKALSAEEALAAARAAETAPPPAAAPAPARPAASPARPRVVDPGDADAVAEDTATAVRALLLKWLPGLNDVKVVRAVVMDDRGMLTALWKAHRARLAASGDLVNAIAVAGVLHALANVGLGKLVAANVVARGQELLLFCDLGAGHPVAAFPDPRSWLGGQK